MTAKPDPDAVFHVKHPEDQAVISTITRNIRTLLRSRAFVQGLAHPEADAGTARQDGATGGGERHMSVHVMLDLETLDLGPRPVIVQLGAVAFDPAESLLLPGWPRFERTVSIDSGLRVGLTVGGSTLAWWFGQSDAARRAIIESPVELAEALDQFRGFLNNVTGSSPETLCLWSHGAAFDVPILEAAYRACDLAVPWGHRAARDTRTLFWLAEERGWEKPQRETAHTALIDAIEQVLDVQSAYAALRRSA